MWYPTLPDLLELHSRIASFEGDDGKVRDPAVLDKTIVAPQRIGDEDHTTESLARKAASLIVPIVRDRAFETCNEETAFAVATVFLDRNGLAFHTSLSEIEEQFMHIREGNVEIPRLSAWIEARLKTQFDREHLRRILTAINRLANVVEDLRDMPGLSRQVATLDSVGNAICVELVALFSLDDETKAEIQDSYPALHEQWGQVFER